MPTIASVPTILATLDEQTEMIPPFNELGRLPVGRHGASAAEVEQRFVHPFPDSLTRAGLYAGWRRRREVLGDLLNVESEWVNGSFVTAKRDPSDIDVVTLILQDVYEALPLQDRREVADLVMGDRPRREFGCDSYVLVVRGQGQAGYDQYVKDVMYWDNYWSLDRVPDIRKGYIEVR